MSGPLREKVEETGREAKDAAVTGFQVAEKTSGKAEMADTAGDEAIEAATSAFHKSLMDTQEVTKEVAVKARDMAAITKESSEMAIDAANTAGSKADDSAKLARSAVEEMRKSMTPETVTKTDKAGREAKRAGAAAFRAAEELARRAGIADIDGDEAIKVAARLFGPFSEDVQKVGREAKNAAATGFHVAEKTRDKANTADTVGDDAIEAAMKVAQDALQKAQNALTRDMARKIIGSWQFLGIAIIILLGAIWAAVSISLSVSLIGR